MVFSTWADFLCGHDGSQETNKGTDILGSHFVSSVDALDNLRGEGGTLFMGIASDGSPLFVHHLTDLGSNRLSAEPYLVALVGLQKSTTVVKLAPSASLGPIPGTDDHVEEIDFVVPTTAKLMSAASPESFKACKMQLYVLGRMCCIIMYELDRAECELARSFVTRTFVFY